MDEEEQKPKEDKPEDSAKDIKEGDKYETTPVIELARKNAERLEEANKKKEELLDREEQIMAKRALGGEAEAGQVAEVKEETPEEYAKKVMAGEV